VEFKNSLEGTVKETHQLQREQTKTVSRKCRAAGEPRSCAPTGFVAGPIEVKQTTNKLPTPVTPSATIQESQVTSPHAPGTALPSYRFPTRGDIRVGAAECLSPIPTDLRRPQYQPWYLWHFPCWSMCWTLHLRHQAG